MSGDNREFAADTRALVLHAIDILQRRTVFMKMDKTSRALCDVYNIAKGEQLTANWIE